MQRAVTPKTAEVIDMNPTIKVWLGGDWQRSASGEVIPTTAEVPNPNSQRQFMAHDENGIRLDHKHGIYGHRSIEDVEVEICPQEIFDALVSQEERDIRSFYGDKTDPKYVEDKIKAKTDLMREKYAARNAKVRLAIAKRAAKSDEAIIAAGEAAQARQTEAAKASKADKGRGAST